MPEHDVDLSALAAAAFHGPATGADRRWLVRRLKKLEEEGYPAHWEELWDAALQATEGASYVDAMAIAARVSSELNRLACRLPKALLGRRRPRAAAVLLILEHLAREVVDGK